MTIFLILWAISTICSLFLTYILIRKDVFGKFDMMPAIIFSFIPFAGLVVVLITGIGDLNKTKDFEQKLYDWIKS